VRTGIVVNGRTINVFSTHVDYYNSSYRTTQTNQAKNWMDNFSAPRIMMGDFNTTPGTGDYKIMAYVYGDAWAVAKSKGTASNFKSNEGTRGASRFDYVYFSKSSPLSVKSVNVPNTWQNGAYPSDHDPVVAVFQVQ
jgi:endonuclease/exonuclease/phosphatase family metal-dependent hydrolase